MCDLRKFIVRGAGVVWLGTWLYFALRPNTDFAWNDLVVALLSVLMICIWIGLHATRFTNWRTLALLIATQLLAQGWLQWQWNLWETEIRNLNALVALWAVNSFAAILMVSTLLLIRRDASVIALVVVWMGCPLGLLMMMMRHNSAAQLENLPIRESSLLVTGMCLLGFLAVGGMIAFGTHFLRLVYLELADQG